MTRSGLRRDRAIIAVLRTGRIPGQNVTQLEFCDLVRTAARIREMPGGFPRGWSKASIMNSASKVTGGPAMLCALRTHERSSRRYTRDGVNR